MNNDQILNPLSNIPLPLKTDKMDQQSQDVSNTGQEVTFDKIIKKKHHNKKGLSISIPKQNVFLKGLINTQNKVLYFNINDLSIENILKFDLHNNERLATSYKKIDA